ncbi:hypothetical protein BJV82DRAFT_669974 [Fennellomyces sp. T-0311]|nr:hypothetical protein BJV82DRAFT_669974 [Fennellomyces sp. T-0311]
MFSQLISSPKVLDIELLEPVVHLHGRRGDAVLRGTVGITLSKPYVLKSLVLLFEGEQRLVRSGQKVTRRCIAHHKLVMYPSTHDAPSISLQSGKNRFGFEMQLPPGLAGTIECHRIRVDYKLTVSAGYHRLASPATVQKRQFTKPIQLVRPPSSSTLSVLVNGENIESCVDSQKQHSRWCQYNITIDQRAVVMGQTLPVTLRIAPHLEGLRLEHIYTQLVERRHIRNVSGKWETDRSDHMLLPVDKSAFVPGRAQSLREPWQGTVSYHIASVMEGGLVRTCKRESPDYYIDHSIIVSFVVSFPVLGRHREVRRFTKTIVFESDIDILDPLCCTKISSQHNCLHALPPYIEQEASPSVPHNHFLSPPATPPPYDDICAS